MRHLRVRALVVLSLLTAFSGASHAEPESTAPPLQLAQVGISRPVLNVVDEGMGDKEGDDLLKHFRQSSVLLRTLARVYGLDKGAEQTWNPTVYEYVDISPRYWLTDDSSIAIGVNFQHEFTKDDTATYANETFVGDFRAGYSIANIARIPVVDIDISASFGLTLPLSKWSQAAGLIATISPGIQFSHTFDKVLEGLTLGYSVQLTKRFHKYTTSSIESPIVPGCLPGASTNCDSLTNTGFRNSSFTFSHGLSVSLAIAPWVSVSTDVLAYTSWLYDATDDDRISLTPQEPTNTRHSLYVDLGASFVPWTPMSIRVGLNTFAPQLAPDSSRYFPGLNTFTNLYFDLRFDVAGVIRALR